MRQASLSDGTRLDVDVAVVALGSVRNVEWLHGSRLAAGPLGVSADAGAAPSTSTALSPTTSSWPATWLGSPHPLYGYQFLSLEHWENAVAQAKVVAHNMLCPPMRPCPAHFRTVVLVDPVRGQHQVRRRPVVRRQDPVH